MHERNGADRYRERLTALEALSGRLTIAGVPHTLYRHVPNCAPSPGDQPTMPAIDVAGGWRQVKVLYWGGEPRFAYPRIFDRHPVDEAGTDQLASRITMNFLDARAHGQVDNDRRQM